MQLILRLVKVIFHLFYEVGIDLRKLISYRYLLLFSLQAKKFKSLGGKIDKYRPILTDFSTGAGVDKGHYFHQDLLVASYIYRRCPVRHIDIGSRIDGFVAHVASYRTIEVMDFRDLKKSPHENIIFYKSDLMIGKNNQREIADSISCLHAIEHFGLGRYGDQVDPYGHIKGFNNIFSMLKPEGYLYISFPIGKVNQVIFNAHRVFHPLDIITWFEDQNSYQLTCFDYVDDFGNLYKNADLFEMKPTFEYGCGIYTFKKCKVL